MTIHDPPEWTVHPACVVALACSPCRLPVRETETRHNGAVVIRTVARRENESTIQVSRTFLERLDAEIQADKQTIRELRGVAKNLLAYCEATTTDQKAYTSAEWQEALKQAQSVAVITRGRWCGEEVKADLAAAREAIAKSSKQTP